MKKYLYLYTGGKPPATPEAGKKMLDDWKAYFAKIGDRLDSGGPLGPHKSVGVRNGSQPNGYSIVEATDIDHAVALTKGHPHLANNGTIDVCEIQPIPE
jgi:hypothetical protein